MPELLGLDGKPYRKPDPAVLTEEIAGPSLGSVRQVTSGHPADGLTPQRLASILRAAEVSDATPFLEMAEQMEEKDLHYGAVLGVRKRAVRKLDLVVKPASNSDADEKAAELVRATLNQSKFKLCLSDMMDGLGKGYSVIELIWATSASQWSIVDFKHRDPRWFKYDPADASTLLLRDNAGDLPLVPGKFAVHEPRLKSGQQIRSGLGRTAAWAYLFKNFTIKDWQIFLETYGHPLRVGKYGPNASDDDKRTLLRALKMMGTDMAGIVPQSMEIELITAAVNQADKLFEGNAEFWDRQVSKAVLGQTGTTDAIAGGHAVGKIHNEVREDIRDADAEQLAATIQEQIAAPLTSFNVAGAACPQISFEAPEEHAPSDVMAAIKEFGPKGLQVSVGFVREKFGIREPQDGEELLTFAANAQTSPPEGGAGEEGTDPAAPGGTKAAAADHAHGMDAIREMTETLLAGRNPRTRIAMLDELMEALQAAETPEDARDVLAMFVDQAPDEGLVGLLTNITLISRLSGELGGNLT